MLLKSVTLFCKPDICQYVNVYCVSQDTEKNAARAPFTYFADSVQLPQDESHPTIWKQENEEHGDWNMSQTGKKPTKYFIHAKVSGRA